MSYRREMVCPILEQRVDAVYGQPHQPAHQRAVDPDILQVAPDRMFQPAGDGPRVPAAHRLADQLDDGIAIGRRRSHRRAAHETIDEEAKPVVLLQGRAKLVERLIASFEPRSPAQSAWLAVAQARRADVQAGKAALVPGDEAVARVRARLK